MLNSFCPLFFPPVIPAGLPHSSLFPMRSCTFTVPSAEYLSSADVTGWTRGEASTTTFSLRKDGPGIFSGLPVGVLDLSCVLQYGQSAGYEVLVKPLAELNQLVHGKTISDASVFLTLGCTDGVSKTFMLFCEPVRRVMCAVPSFAEISLPPFRATMYFASSTPSAAA